MFPPVMWVILRYYLPTIRRTGLVRRLAELLSVDEVVCLGAGGREPDLLGNVFSLDAVSGVD